MTRILVTGASGLLGLNFCLQYAGQHEIMGLTHSLPLSGTPFKVIQADLTQPDVAIKVITATGPVLIVHCAAAANLEVAEANPALAWRLNAEVPGEVAAAARRVGAQMIHISTDAVFDGLSGNYSESDPPNPLSVYAQSKLAGEQAVAAVNPDAIIARVNFYGWSALGRRSLAEFFYTNLTAGIPIPGFTDVFFNPLHTHGLNEILMRMVDLKLSGLFHVVSRESLSKYDFGCRIARLFGLDPRTIQPASWKTAGLAAARAPNLNLRTEKLARALGEPLPDQAAGLERFHTLYQEGYHDRIRQFLSSAK